MFIQKMIPSRLKSNIGHGGNLLRSLYLKLLKPQPQTHKASGSANLLKGLLAPLTLLVCASPTPGFALSFDDIQDRGVISVAVYRDFAPFSYRENGQAKGVDVEIAQVIANGLGVRLDLFELSADENVDDDLRNAIWKGHYLDRKKADIMLHVPYDNELARRNDLVVLFAPYYREDMVVARDIKKLGKDATLGHFRYEKIAVELDSLADIYLSAAFGGSVRNNVLHFPTIQEAADQAIAQKAFGLMGPRSVVEAALGAHIAQYDIGKIPTPGLSRESWLLGLAVKNDYRQLGYAVGDIIAAMVMDGRMKALFEKYGLTYTPPPASFYN